MYSSTSNLHQPSSNDFQPSRGFNHHFQKRAVPCCAATWKWRWEKVALPKSTTAVTDRT